MRDHFEINENYYEVYPDSSNLKMNVEKTNRFKISFLPDASAYTRFYEKRPVNVWHGIAKIGGY